MTEVLFKNVKDKETETWRRETTPPRSHSYIARHRDTHTL